MSESVPARLYKYQPCNPQTLDNLKKRILWFSKPECFNDPFDGSMGYRLEDITDEEWQALAQFFAGKWPKGPIDFQRVHVTDEKPNEAFRKKALEGARLASENLVKWVKERGVACFSEKVDDLLMWAHYADGHRGMCLEFDTRYGPFDKMTQKVEYSNHYPVVNIAKAVLGKTFTNVPELTTKADVWSYEKEWRLLHEQGNIEFQLDVEALTGVYFGCAMSMVHIEIVALMLRGSPTKLYKMERSQVDFSVKPVAFEYHPFDYSNKDS
jgi:hypothetical protein